jgi:hypothetical protein
MNKYYAIIPLGLLLGFLVIYRGAVSEMEVRETKLKQEAQAKADAEELEHKKIEEKAAEDAAKQQAIREAADKAKQDKKENDYNAAMTQLKTEADNYSTDADKFAKEAADLELELSKSHTLKDKTSTEAFDLSKQVELAKIDRRNAELEIQRLVEMVGTKAAASSLTAMPPPAPLPPAK